MRESAVSFPTTLAREATAGPVEVGPLFVLGGTTASGKSALALALADRLEAVIVNADSQQLFADLAILTARPTPAEETRVPHRLYGVLGPREQPSAGRWLGLVLPVLVELAAAGRAAILVGGTGLYLHALVRGLSPIPEVPAALRARLLDETRDLPAPALHARLARLDPLTAARLRPSDRQRVLRALEVLEATGRPLALWQSEPRHPPVRARTLLGVALLPPAAITSPRIVARLEHQLAGGALDEVAALAERQPGLAEAARAGRPEGWPILKVHGCRELLAVLEGRLERATAEAEIARQVRAYAKRQRTFFRHQLPELEPLALTGEEEGLAERLARRFETLRAP
ncbi:MAG: tRNA (adenosine(37)-N6)-dimethylallyltransferase MiaA [Geminicoccaceae bacterium]|nr:tRNA (adenosine(37)-N6)-dimethylallyltransferase MiaA [Geminicoccaceae bacterium]MDW8368938.1 tRNA (adenosine(37)-N6)-dimethylallyltransferase MiaA [Geminicoccaceae bacterium]